MLILSYIYVELSGSALAVSLPALVLIEVNGEDLPFFVEGLPYKKNSCLLWEIDRLTTTMF